MINMNIGKICLFSITPPWFLSLDQMVGSGLTTFKLEGEVTSLSESSQGEVGDNRVKWGDFLEKLIAINRNIVLRPSEVTLPKFSKQLKSCLN